jgi:DnaJ-class molecular chaperone
MNPITSLGGITCPRCDGTGLEPNQRGIPVEEREDCVACKGNAMLDVDPTDDEAVNRHREG